MFSYSNIEKTVLFLLFFEIIRFFIKLKLLISNIKIINLLFNSKEQIIKPLINTFLLAKVNVFNSEFMIDKL